MRLRISARLDGELSERHQARLARHLDRCDACAQFAHALAGLTEVLRAKWSSYDAEPTGATTNGKAGHLLLLGALTLILGAGKSADTTNHARCHSLWGVAGFGSA
jgi:hypothetical protein